MVNVGLAKVRAKDAQRREGDTKQLNGRSGTKQLDGKAPCEAVGVCATSTPGREAHTHCEETMSEQPKVEGNIALIFRYGHAAMCKRDG